MHHCVRAILLVVALIPLNACVHHTFVPGPGMSILDFEPDSARCRLFARGANPGFDYSATGSQQFVAASMAGMVIGGAIDSAVRENENYNDCMEARGWRVADNAPAVIGVAERTNGTVASHVSVQPPSISSVASRQDVQVELGIRAAGVTDAVASYLHLTPAQGVVIVSVNPDSAASYAGLSPDDVILEVGRMPITSIADLQKSLAVTPSNGVVIATIWSGGHERQVQIRL